MQLLARTSTALRCAYCHDDLSAGFVPCAACGTGLHSDCWERLDACPSLGCGGGPR